MGTNNAINANSTGLVRYNGSGTYDAVTTTNHDVLIGAASNGITNVAPSATSGVPLISQGAAADPAFGTAVVAGGGTGVATLTGLALGSGTSAFTGVTYTQTTFTPVLSGTGTAGTPTYTRQIGYYTQIGNFVWININISWSAAGGATGNWQITGLPLTSKNTTGLFWPLSAVWGGDTNTLASGSGALPAQLLGPNATSFVLTYYGQAAGNINNLAVSGFSSGSVAIQGFYSV